MVRCPSFPHLRIGVVVGASPESLVDVPRASTSASTAKIERCRLFECARSRTRAGSKVKGGVWGDASSMDFFTISAAPWGGRSNGAVKKAVAPIYRARPVVHRAGIEFDIGADWLMAFRFYADGRSNHLPMQIRHFFFVFAISLSLSTSVTCPLI